MKEHPLRKRVINAFLWLSTGTIFIQAISWVSTIIVIRLLTPSDYGLMAMALPIIFFIQMLSSWGFGMALVQDKNLNDTQIRGLLGFIIVVFLSSFVIINLTAPLIASFFHEIKLISLLQLLSINLILMIFYVIPDAMFFREMDFRTKTKVEISSRLVASIVAPVCAFNSMGVWSLAIAEICLHITRSIHFNLAFQRWYIPSFRFKECKHLIKYGLTITGTNVFTYIFNQADKIIVGRVLGKDLLGLYSVSFNLALIPKEKIIPIVTQLSFSTYSKIQDNAERIRSSLLMTIEAISFVAFPLFWGMASIANEAIPLILGPNWIKATIPFQYLCIIIPLLSISPIYPSVLNAIGRQEVVFVNSIIEALIMTLAILLGVRFGLIGVCITWIYFFPITFFVISQRSLNSIQLGLLDLLAKFKFPVLASLTMALSIGIIKKLLAAYTDPSLLLILVVLVGVIIYTLLVFMFKKDFLLDMKFIFRK